MSAPPLTLAAIRQPAFLFEADGRIAVANDLAEALAGRPLRDCTAADVIATLGVRRPDGTPVVPAELPEYRALAGEEAIDLPLAITASDGRAVHVLATASPLWDGSSVTGVLCVWQDVTERRRAEMELESIARFPAENPNPVLRLADGRTIIYANAAALAMLGEPARRPRCGDDRRYCPDSDDCARLRHHARDGVFEGRRDLSPFRRPRGGSPLP